MGLFEICLCVFTGRNIANDSASVPRNAVLTVTLCFGVLAALSLLMIATLSHLFEPTGVSFFFSYCLCIIVWIKSTRRKISRSAGILLLFFEFALYCTFGLKAVYPVLFFMAGLLLPTKVLNSFALTFNSQSPVCEIIKSHPPVLMLLQFVAHPSACT